MLAPPATGGLTALRRARGLALAIPLALLGGALLSQYVGGLYPCEMCWWQRYPHALAILVAALAFTRPANSAVSRALVLVAALAIATSGAIGVFHAGVEYGWWQGFTTCTSTGAASLEDILAAPVIRCDQVQWSLAGISLAGFNAIISISGALLILGLLARGRKGAA